ncbi:ankyrin, partial [Thozetella sp. PMI_491]
MTNWHQYPFSKLSPLFWASNNSNEIAISALLEAGYAVDGLTLASAIYAGLSVDVIKKLGEQCVNLNASWSGSEDEEILECRPPIAFALHHEDTSIIQILVELGADIDAEWLGSWNGIDTALTNAIDAGQLHSAEILLNLNADPNKPAWSPKMIWRNTALELAARKGYIGMVRRLLRCGADINARRKFDRLTALEAAAYCGRLDVVQLLLDSEICTDGFCRVQYIQALWYSERNGYYAVAELLRSHRQWTDHDAAV